MPQPHHFASWQDATPSGFLFAVKVWRGITHFRKLRNTREFLDRFLEAANVLAPDRRAPLLVQLPPNQRIDLPKLDSFLEELSTAAPDWKAAVEFRHDSWNIPETLALLDRRNTSLCVHDMGGKGAVSEANRVDFVYLRRHGSALHQEGGYLPEQIAADAGVILRWLAEGRTVYAYYNNDWGGHALWNARDLHRAVQQRSR